MKRSWIKCLASLVILGSLSGPARGSDPSIGRTIDDFSLQSFRGKHHRLSEYNQRRLVVVAFLGVECPLARLYGPRLAALAKVYEGKGVVFLGINSNCQDSITEIDAYVRRYQVGFPMLKDSANRVADAFQAERTPEVFVLDEERRIRYRGRIDDQYGVGYAREKPVRQDLKAALDDLLAGRKVAQPITETVGCHIGRVTKPKAESDVTYAKQISRILQKHCVECHRPTEIAPFSLTDYDEVVGWSKMIEEVVAEQRMPPWSADPAHGKFSNARLLSPEEKELITRWVKNGAPEGDTRDLPALRQFADGWHLPRQPDVIIPMRDRPFRVPAQGVVEYQYFVVDPKFEKDTWVTAAEVVAGNRSVVHHAIVFVRPPDDTPQRGIGWLAAYVPGQGTRVLAPGQGRLIPAGSKLIFQMHYTPTGSEQDDLTKIGLLLGDREKIREEVVTYVAIDRYLEIPPRVNKHRVSVSVDWLPKDGKLLALAPHMHLRGKSFRFVAQRGGEHETLLSVPRYDFNWQHAYLLKEPQPIGKNLKLLCEASYDNSAANLVNPDPSATVHWGDQTHEEMFVAYMEVALPVQNRAPDPSLIRRRQTRANDEATEFIRRFDKNGDQQLVPKEVPSAVSAFAFRKIDTNKDDVITLTEAAQAALKSLRRKD